MSIREAIESLGPRVVEPPGPTVPIHVAITMLEMSLLVSPPHGQRNTEAALDDLRRAQIDPEFRAELHNERISE